MEGKVYSLEARSKAIFGLLQVSLVKYVSLLFILFKYNQTVLNSPLNANFLAY